MIKLINVYKDSRVMELTPTSNIGLGITNDNEIDILRFKFDDLIVGEATLLTDLKDSHGDYVAFPLTLNQENNSYDLVITQSIVSESTLTFQIELTYDEDKIWHSKQATLQVDECLEIGEGEMPTTIDNWLQNANLVLAEMQEATNETNNLNIEVGTETPTSIPVTFTDKNGDKTIVNIKGEKGENATINGVSMLTIEAGENIALNQSGSTMTISSTASGGSSDYTDLTNKPLINNVTLSGNKSLSDLGIQPSGSYVTSTDYATSSKGGVVKIDQNYGLRISNGTLIGYGVNYNDYINALNQLVVDKGTLENVITGKGLATETYVNNAIASAVTDTLGGSY